MGYAILQPIEKGGIATAIIAVTTPTGFSSELNSLTGTTSGDIVLQRTRPPMLITAYQASRLCIASNAESVV